MGITVSIYNPASGAAVAVTLKVAESELPFDFHNETLAKVQELDVSVDPEFPYLTYKAIDAACVSGAVYARRLLGVRGIKVKLTDFSWSGRIENAEPFAVAVRFAICKALSNGCSDLDLNGWTEKLREAG